jgi:hypothetical protein
VQVGDRLLEVEEEDFDLYFTPRSPEQAVSGRIISVYDGVSQIGQYHIVVVSLGEREGIEKGHVLSIYSAGKTVKDTVTADPKDTIILPDEYAGVAMVFKTYNKVSYAIVMKASRFIHVLDRVASAP